MQATASSITSPTIAPLPPAGLRYAFVHASWHADIVLRGRHATPMENP